MRNNYNVLDCVQTQSSRKTFYPTPEPIAEKMLESKDWMMIGSVLEPSAGKGDLALYAAKKLYKNRRGYLVYDERSTNEAIEGSDIDCIEIDPALRSVLDDKGYRVVHDDFLTFETQKRYDLILMNPPFDHGAEHLLHALELCEHGGIVACVLNAETLRNPHTSTRQELAKRLKEYEARVEFIPGAFKDAERKTDVEVALVRVDIPRAQPDSTIMEDMRKAPTYKSKAVPFKADDMVLYNEVEEWVSRYEYEIACGIRLIEEYLAMKPFMIENPDDRYARSILSLNIQTGSDRHSETTINGYIRETRGKYWRAIFQRPTFTRKLTNNLLQELHSSVDKLKDYDFSVYNILTLMIKMNAKVIGGIEETIINLFDDWTRMYWHEESPNRHYYNGWKTNDCFRVGKKVILPFYGAYDSWDKKFRSYNVQRKFADIEKIFDFLDSGRTEWEGTLEKALQLAEATENTRNIDTKYFTATFYKKGTAHLVFKDENLLEKFNLFASMKKGWLPPNYGRKRYSDMRPEEQSVVDSFQGREKYEQVMAQADYFLNSGQPQLMIGG